METRSQHTSRRRAQQEQFTRTSTAHLASSGSRRPTNFFTLKRLLLLLLYYYTLSDEPRPADNATCRAGAQTARKTQLRQIRCTEVCINARKRWMMSSFFFVSPDLRNYLCVYNTASNCIEDRRGFIFISRRFKRGGEIRRTN